VNELRVVIVGLGFGKTVHLAAYRLASGYEVVALVGRDTERAREAARMSQVENGYSSLAEALERCRPDLVSIAVPPAAQSALAGEALRAGAHVFCEKPLSTTLTEARKIEETARLCRRQGAVDFIFPEIPAWRKLKETIENGILGTVKKASVCWKVETRAARPGSASWKNDPQAGGGVLLNFVPHSIYYLQWLFGEIIGARSLPLKNHSLEFIGSFLFQSGLEVDLHVDGGAFMGLGHRLEVFGEKGSLLLENATPDYVAGFALLISMRESPGWKFLLQDSEPASTDARIRVVASILRRFRENIISGLEIRPGLRDGLQVQKVLWAVQQSAADAAPAISTPL
jgi:UDP-N-acetyl-2-amino-2-deoxyglucuronate dehydrogenase